MSIPLPRDDLATRSGVHVFEAPPLLAPAPPARWRDRAHLLALGILLLAAGLRFASLGFDLDLRDPERTLLYNHADARGQVLTLLAAMKSRDIDPDNYLLHGPGGFFVMGAVDVTVVSVLACRNPGGWNGAVQELEQNPALIAWLHRFVSALAGTLTVLAMMRLTWREFGRDAGLCAGLVLASAYLHVRDSHLGTTDTLWGLALVLALDACFRLSADPSAARHAQAGLLAGTAAAMKYFGVVLLLHVCLAHWLARTRARDRGRTPPPARRLVLAFALVGVAFLALTGSFTGSFETLIGKVGYGARKLSPHWDGVSQLEMLRFHVGETLSVGLGEPAFLAALAGLIVAWRRHGQGRFLVLAVLGVVPSLFFTAAPVVRYGMGVLVVLAIPAGIALAAARARLPRLAGTALVLAAVAPSLFRSVALDLVWQHPDTRLEVAAEMRRLCAPGDEVLAIGLRADQPYPGRQPYDYRNYLLAFAAGRLTPSDVLASPPAWILWGVATPRVFIPGADELERLVRTDYREVLRLETRRDASVFVGESKTVPRALGVPYSRPWAVERPGPPLVLYERVP